MSNLITLLSNKIFLAGILSILICQFLKMVILSIKNKKFNPRDFFELSGMPSTHTATIIAISSMVYFQEGISTLFIITVFIVIYMIDEVLWMEESLGLHAKIFNKLSETIKLQKLIPSSLRERWGHTYDEIIVGSVIGWIISWAINNYFLVPY